MTKITLDYRPIPDKVAFSDLSVGQWYSSHSCYGICIKTHRAIFYSLAYNKPIKATSTDWECTPIDNVKVIVS